MAEKESTEIILYKSTDGVTQIEVTTDYDTVWLTKDQMAELFGRDRTVISRHINNIFKEGELEKDASTIFVQNLHENKRGRGRPVEYFSLDVIISVGYRVKSKRGVEFRKWALQILKQYLLEGYVINEQRIQKTPGSLIEMFKMQVQLWERQELKNNELEEQIKNVARQIQMIESRIRSRDEHYYTIAGYCSLKKIPCPLSQAKAWGKRATKLSREKDIPMDTAHDERFGRVRTYHVTILDEVIP